MSINFCRVISFQEGNYLCAGTDDGRVLLWKDGMFQAISLPNNLNYVIVVLFNLDKCV